MRKAIEEVSRREILKLKGIVEELKPVLDQIDMDNVVSTARLYRERRP
ncbi:MAG: hypothetical protein N3H84_05205 [Candidatus Caldarchaeum sp.]|nr:hypothetical protein [Candidatus Caldarchaeum sp.]MCX8201484.1 hypothetical protein [Candidatus Caldarchaeum sp.]MDW8434595.1 hypothetical protein [Candidatus Caldarchaeum sp.]